MVARVHAQLKSLKSLPGNRLRKMDDQLFCSAADALQYFWTLSSDDEDSDFEGDGIFSYRPGGLPDDGMVGGGENGEEEGTAISAQEDSGQPVLQGSRDQADGEYRPPECIASSLAARKSLRRFYSLFSPCCLR